MPADKLIVICQSGGKFISTSDGSLSYTGGEAHAISINRDSKFNELKSEIAEMWSYNHDEFTIRYFVPGNRHTLITISSEKDIQRMIDFHEGSLTVDIFVVLINEILPNDADASAVPCSRSSGNTVVEPRSSGNTMVEPRSSGNTMVEPVTPLNVSPVNFVAGDMEENNPSGNEAVYTIQNKLFKSWENCITGLHQQFNTVQELREALRRYSIAHGFKLAFKHNDATRVSAKCKAEGCPWRVHASKLSTTPLFRIKRIIETHMCGAETGRFSPPKASRKLVATIVKEKLRDTPNFSPKEMAKQIRQEFGIELRYSQAWRGMEIAKEELQGSYKEAYNQLPWLCKKMQETNPGSVITLATREDQTFHRVFVALHASIFGFQNGCRPLILLDSILLKSKYQSDLLTATAFDGNDGIFPVAFAIVDVITDDNWHWFLEQLKSALSPFQPITFVADRHIALRQSILLLFEDSHHGFCLHNLSEDLKKDLKGPHTEEVLNVIIGHLYDAANSATLDGFRRCIASIKSISPEAFEWIMQTVPEHWANSLFEGSRFGHFTSRSGQSFYSWVNELPTLPVVQIVDTIRQKLMELIYSRKVESDKWSTKLTPSLENKLQKGIHKAKSLQVSLSPGGGFEVYDCFGDTNVVNIDTWNCSCREWQLNGFPCYHAVAVLQHCNRDLCDYCSRYYTTDAYRLAYMEPINPVPTADKPVNKESSPIQVKPPLLRLLSGPPKQRRIRSKGVIKRPLRCSKCKGVGHNRATCHVFS
ncbi:uncharacterized protein [Euphorbia lathyris]|uniref:uncharacterized protein n=1 Tax=Euphorbia lathyris TaxID=212925 RepID=UPI0033133669